MSLPMRFARENDLAVDGFTIFTDNETWHGNSHPLQELTAYRSATNPWARVAVAAMAPNKWSILDPKDPGVLSVTGVDSSLPVAVNGFFRNPRG